ncbi:hypothetical protein SARC_06282 [Sphaeroforma arctica JP610]|uniref:Uncharacterized protein n=1 Tax=Sphaeroforma arctica JP610 TaxID=667725 RepID=A0A0L0FX20_9EUKA|nr:hypothetical protein SARC_06282 [Sphaeroforma arctica JP610]KNC81395.1 hypothetical protein SARC_06282 [Sphaeroforma arctica JP610]|eukprot:XP_014155297.1 hypothetical protein SARC_06282 [Sphaeroforma arctica JP610]
MDLAGGTYQIQLGTLRKTDADDDSTKLAPISVRGHTGASVVKSGPLGLGTNGPCGSGIKSIVYSSETKSLQLPLDTQAVIEIPNFVGVDGEPGPVAIDLDAPVAGPAGPEGSEGPRGTDGGLDMRHTMPYADEGDSVL